MKPLGEGFFSQKLNMGNEEEEVGEKRGFIK